MTLWTIAKNDLRITIKDKMFLAWMLVFPLIFTLIFGMAFQGMGSQDTQVTLNIRDKDHSLLSQSMIDELASKKYAIHVLKSSEEQAFRTLIIPSGFEKSVLAGQQVELKLEQEQGRSLEAMQTAYSHVLKAIIKVLARIVMISPEDTEALEQEYSKAEWERRITLRSEVGGKLVAIPDGFNHSVPSMVVMFLLFTVLMYGGINLLEERRNGQLERIYLSPATFGSIIAGKWLSRILLGMIQISLLFLAGKFIFGVYLGHSIPILFLLSFLFCATIAGMSMLFGSIIKKEEILIVLNILLANLMSGLGGCWWPMELVPDGLQKVGFLLPTAWIMDAYHKLIFFGHGLESVLVHLAVLTGYTVLFLFLAIRFFKIRK